ncbi:MAG: hypothetical protein ACFFBR_00440 [Promethearchaeota archaeon]
MSDEQPLENQVWRPVVTERRWNWVVSGFVNLILILLIALIIWWVLVDPRIEFSGVHNWLYTWYASVIAGFGILAVVVQIWFDHYPYGRFRDIFSHAMWGIIINILLVALAIVFFWFIVGPFMIPMFSPLALMNVPDPIFLDPDMIVFLSASAMGTILSCGFSFAAIWVAGGMFWPFTELKPVKRGFAVFTVAAIITAIAWFILYWPYQILTAVPPLPSVVTWTIWTAVPIWALYDPIIGVTNWGAYISLNFTQWIIVFGLLTLMTYEYGPWNRLGKQPWIGLGALIGSIVLGALFSLYLMPYLILPTLLPGLNVSGTMFEYHATSVQIAVWILLMIVIWTYYFSNKPTRFHPAVNNLLRTLAIVFFAIVAYILFWFIAPILIGETALVATQNPVRWVLWLLWFMLLHIYIMKRWPGWKIVSFAEGKHRKPKPESEPQPEAEEMPESGFE